MKYHAVCETWAQVQATMSIGQREKTLTLTYKGKSAILPVNASFLQCPEHDDTLIALAQYQALVVKCYAAWIAHVIQQKLNGYPVRFTRKQAKEAQTRLTRLFGKEFVMQLIQLGSDFAANPKATITQLRRQA